MKNSLTFIVLLTSATMGFAQGKVAFTTDSLHLVYFSTDTAKLLPESEALAGRGLFEPTLALAGVTMVADLWAGTSATSLQKVTTAPGWATAAEGRWTTANVILPSPTFPAGVAAFFRVDIHDSRVGSASEAWAELAMYGGMSEVFTAVPSPNVYAQIYSPSSAHSTWAPGTFPMDFLLAGCRGAIEVSLIPEPSTLGLLGLGAAGLMIARRRR
jgi:hypothetical protein